MKITKLYLPALVIMLVVSLSACGDTQSATTAPSGNSVETTERSGRPNAKLVSERWLRGQFPVQLGSEKLNQSGATTTDLLDYEVCKAQATYGDDRTAALTITDLAKFGSNLGGITPWLGKDLNASTGASFQRTSFIENNPSMETYDATQELATISVLVGGRFLVVATSKEWKTSQLRDAVATMELEELAKGE